MKKSRIKTKNIPAMLALLLIITIWQVFFPELFIEQQVLTGNIEVGIVERVVDGDTLVVLLDGASYKVRLIGVDSPESVHADTTKNSKEGEAAAAFTKGLLKEGMRVFLEKDQSEEDRYGRLLRYVWLEAPDESVDVSFAKKYMLNALLVVNGYAVPKEYKPDTKYSALLQQLDEQSSD